MIVVDASVLVDVLLHVGPTNVLERRLLAAGETAHVPHLVDIEVMQVLRRRTIGGRMAASRGHMAIDDLAALPLLRHPHDHLLPRVWELRYNISAYDAVYVALAEYLGAPLLTRDRRLAAAPGHRVRIDLV